MRREPAHIPSMGRLVGPTIFSGAFLSLFFLSLFSLDRIHADEAVQAPFLLDNPGVRTAALGGDQITLRDSLEVLFSNPASLTSLSNPEVYVGHEQNYLDVTRETVAAGFPFRQYGLGMGVSYFNYGSFDRTTLDEASDSFVDDGSFRPYTLLSHLGGAVSLKPGVSAGLVGKGWISHLDEQSTEGVALDIGLNADRVLKYFQTGLVLRNLGPKKAGEDLPGRAVYGLAAQPTHEKWKFLKAYAEYDQGLKTEDTIRAGLELNRNIVSVRAGSQLPAGGGSSGSTLFTLGAGFRYKGFKIDYTWKGHETLGTVHMISISAGLGLSPEEKALIDTKVESELLSRAEEKASTYKTRGESDLKQGRYDEALENFNLAQSWNPDDLSLYPLIKTAQEKRKKSQFEVVTKQPAVTSSQDLAKTEKRLVEIYSQNAYSLYRRGQWNEAAKMYERVLALDPGNQDAKLALQTLNDPHRSQPKLAYNEIKAKVNELNIKALQSYGEGRLDLAVKYWNEALNLDPTNEKMKNNLLRAQNELKHGSERP